MPTKHIDEQLWRKVEKKTVDAVVRLQTTVKDTEMLKWLILKGLEEITEEDYSRMKKGEEKKAAKSKG